MTAGARATLPPVDRAHLAGLQAYRDDLHALLTARWGTRALRGATADEYARYWLLQSEYDRAQDAILAHLAGEPEATDPHPLCPECAGQGWIGTSPLVRDRDTGEWLDDPIDCPACGGVGILAPPYGEEAIDA